MSSLAFSVTGSELASGDAKGQVRTWAPQPPP
ncbi:MAG: hypothetical protein U0797_25160 [Gemmataceae bacterium]